MMSTFDRFQIYFDNAGGNGWRDAPALARPTQMIRCDANGSETLLENATGIVRRWSDPLDALRWIDANRTGGRWVGFLSYNLGRLFERLPSVAKNDLQLPLFVFTFHPHAGELNERAANPQEVIRARDNPIRSTFTRGQYIDIVRRCIDYIAAGDIFQVNVSQRFSVAQPAEVLAIYARLKEIAPSQYGACLAYDDFALVSNSPELFLAVDRERRVITRPIKGTRPRADGMQEALQLSTKDQAELNMIVDLERNDLGRVCEVGSVRVTQPRTIETHPTVYHGVATIEGTLRDDVGFVELLRATFPGGSITGAPKIRAMEVIDELEPVRRGPYCGAIGYLDEGGEIEFNIAIRTMIVKDGTVHVSVGGGIVADSDPEAEYEETLVKARAMFDALGLDVDDARL